MRCSELSIGIITGIIFTCGLIISGMARSDMIINFLIVNNDWNPCFLITLSSAIIPNFVTFNLILTK